ncbi:fungal-specific transcription factor domain-containing protein [Ephemerocybe angulata]|uniref:Fungal-specific transcription factor domain-containing protein n=1 Tax=Ephemerocybe angulata TaxID=980116 RepID=A0A8H6M4A7_9AGAR|nr:fungal-specific transcription factor domain-containing protein [Tulosesus angulatus]
MESNGPAKPKQRRLQGSCDLCRRKKGVCDSAKMPGFRCSNCIAFGSACTHLHVAQVGPPPWHQTGHESLTTSIQRTVSSMGNTIPACVLKGLNLSESKPLMYPVIDAVLSPDYQLPTNPILIRQTMSSLAQFARMLDEALTSTTEKLTSYDSSMDPQHVLSSSSNSRTPHTASSSQSGSVSSKSATEEVKKESNSPTMEDVSSLSASLRQGLMLDSHTHRFFGPSSTVMVAKTTLDLTLGQNTESTIEASVARYRRPIYWTRRPWEIIPDPEHQPYAFPEQDLLLHLVERYFTCKNDLLPILHRPSFERALHSGLHLVDDQFGGTVLAVCAIASLFTNDPRVLLEEAGYPEQSGGYKYFRQLRLTTQSILRDPTLYDVQLYALAIVYLNSTSMGEICWQYLGIALRAAQDMALNRKQTRNGERTREAEVRKRVFFVLLMMDEITSAYGGRSAMIKREEFDVDLPADCDDEYWQDEESGEVTFKQPEGRPSKPSYFIHLIKLFGILADVQRAFYSIRTPAPPEGMTLDDWNAERLIELDIALDKWKHNLPEHLRWNPSAPHSLFYDQSATLHANFNWIRILLYRPFIGSKTKKPTDGLLALKVCINAARATISIMDAQSQRGNFIPGVSVVVFLSGIILLVNVCRGKQMGAQLNQEQEMQIIYKAVCVLRTYERCWHSSGRFCDVLYSLLVLSGFSEPQQSPTFGGIGNHRCETYAPPEYVRQTEETGDLARVGPASWHRSYSIDQPSCPQDSAVFGIPLQAHDPPTGGK